MELIENKKIEEKLYIEKLDNGLTIMFVPHKTRKKYIVWATKFGSIDNKFKVNEETFIMPDGIAHYLEHKMFEQESGKNSLDTLSALGVEANAYTTGNHTAYLYECTDNFYEALDEFMNYVQNPYFTDENVEKERGIIGQEIQMYDDSADWSLYLNAIKGMYKENEINIDTAGTLETIAEIDKDKLYRNYYSFYRPDNMAIVVCGDFDKEEIFSEIKKRITMTNREEKISRIYNTEPLEIASKKTIKQMDISMPQFIIGFKDNIFEDNKIKKDIAIDILSNILFSKSSKFYEEIYNEGLIQVEPSITYEFADTYSHVLIQGLAKNVDEVVLRLENRIKSLKENGIDDEDFVIAKRAVYGEMVKIFTDPQTISNNFISNYMRGINLFDYFELFDTIDREYVEIVLEKVFDFDREVISIINPIKN